MNKKKFIVAFFLIGALSIVITGCDNKNINNQKATDNDAVADEQREAAKTPEDKYDEAQATIVIGERVPILTSEIEPALKSVFGKAKITSYSSSSLTDQGIGFAAEFTVPRVVTAEDLNKLILLFKSKGYTPTINAVEAEAGMVTFAKGEDLSISFSYSEGGINQEMNVLYWSLGTN